MSSVVRNGFSTLNRLLGKKNKDSTLSKSTSNLSKSVTNLDSTSQHNKIVPLVAASTNAPFEQTFRVTICLPRDQLYVARVGAKTKLWQLLEMVCTNKLLEKSKFEFRHPSDSSQVYSNDLTIGEVGLNEIRLSLKTDSHHEPYPKFHTDEIVKLRQNSRESLSSSEFSKNSSRQYAKTTSPYSSTNSLSSMDSTGLNSRHHPPIAPSRKKRVAPRPPSQNSSSERSGVIDDHVFKQPHQVMPPKNIFVSSPNLTNTNNDTKANKNNSSDIKIHRIEEQEIEKKPPVRPTSLNVLRKNDIQTNGDNRMTYASPSITPATPATPATPTISETVPNTPHENHSRTSSDSSEVKENRPEPIPRKRTFIAKKQAPAPPPRGLPPVAPPRSVSKVDLNEPVIDATVAANPNISKVLLNVNPDPMPETIDIPARPTTTKSPPPSQNTSPEMPEDSPQTEVKVIANEDDSISQETETDRSTSKTDSSDEEETKVYNIKMGKSLVVETPRKLIEDDEVFENIKNENKEIHIENIENTQQIHPLVLEKVNGNENVTLVNKNLDHIREATPSPRSESPLWSYTLPAPSIFADDRNSEISDVRSEQNIERNDVVNGDLSSEVSDLSDVPIKPVIQQRIPVDFKALDETSNTESSMTSDIEDGYQGDKVRFSRGALLQSLENHRDEFIENEFGFLSKMEGDDEKKSIIKEDEQIANGIAKEVNSIPNQKNDVINELNDVIVNNKIETVIRKSETSDEIESAQKSYLTNFVIQTYSNHVDVKTDSSAEDKTSQTVENIVKHENELNSRKLSEDKANKSDDEIVFRSPKEFTQSPRPSLSNGNLFKSPRISRSDSFHSTSNGSTENVGLTSRSSSYISLIGTSKYENRSNKTTPRNSLTNGTFIDSNRRKSSSELSIANSPSLQSLLVMKSILSNSRKGSLAGDNLSNGSKENGEIEGDQSRKSSVELRSKSPITDLYDDSSKENSPQNKLSSKNEQTDGNTKWKYQGPPAINLCTWGERPKSMIAIKTDKDYKFGAINNVAVNTTEAKPSATEPVLVTNSMKPAGKHINAIVETPAESVDVPDHHLPIVRAVVKKIHPINNGSSDENHSIEIRRSSYEVSKIVPEKTETRIPLQNRFSWKIPATFNNCTTGMHSNLNKNVPTVRGFKTDALEIVADKDQSIDSGYKSLPPTVVLINSNKESREERPKTLPPPTVAKRPSFIRPQKSEESNVVPFSQFTLRKTGLKEKIVGQDADIKESIKQPFVVSPPIQTIQLKQEIVSPTIQTVQLKQTQEQPVVVSQSIQIVQRQTQEQPVTVSSSIQTVQLRQTQEHPVTVSPSFQTIKLRPKQEIPNLRPVTFHATTTTTIPPPPPPIVKQVPIVRGVMTQKSLPIAIEPRDALLDSIKNFNKNNLKKK